MCELIHSYKHSYPFLMRERELEKEQKKTEKEQKRKNIEWIECNESVE